jgi:hypothetical protein
MTGKNTRPWKSPKTTVRRKTCNQNNRFDVSKSLKVQSQLLALIKTKVWQNMMLFFIIKFCMTLN